MKARVVAMRRFDARRVVLVGCLLAGALATAGFAFWGPLAATGVALGAGSSALAFLWLERSLLGRMQPDIKVAPLAAGIIGRLAMLAVPAILLSVYGGAQGGGGFLAGLLAIKTAVLVEGVRCAGA